MRIAIISDIHANVEALDRALAWIDEADVDEIVCLGDVIGYGADPNPCCERIRARCRVTLLGNHDAAVAGLMDTDYYYPAARDAIMWTRQRLTPENFQWLYALPYTWFAHDAGFFHSAPLCPSGFYYVVQTRDARAHAAIYDELARWNFVGHSHLTQSYAFTEKKAKDVTGKALTAQDDRKYLINVGSIGQPRDQDPRLCFGIYDADEGSFDHVRLDYDISSAAAKIERAGLDDKFAKRLFLGR